jgi:hypothetical protein
MLQAKKISSISSLDNDISWYRHFLNLLKVNGANSTFDTAYSNALNTATTLLVNEKRRLESLVKKSLYVSRKKLG